MRQVACGIMLNKKNEILMGLRDSSGPYSGFWEFPGGKLEKGETIEECLKREWIEELNLEIEIDREIYKYNYDKYCCRFFIGKILNENKIKKNVHKQLLYVNKNEISKLKLFEGDYKIIDLI